MSMAVMAYAIKMDELNGVFGSGRTDLDPGEVSTELATAFDELIAGRAPTQATDRYVEALELICRNLGRYLSNAGLSPTDTGHFERVDAALRQYQLGFDLTRVVYNGGPLKHPALATATTFGFVSAAALKKASELLDGEALESDDNDVDEALCSIEGWLTIAVVGEFDIVGFFY